jgi:hypothetical protein
MATKTINKPVEEAVKDEPVEAKPKRTRKVTGPFFENNFPIEQITVDKDLQARAQMNNDAIGDYKDAIMDGVELPPMTVFTDGKTWWLTDGFHRYQAYKKLQILEVPVNIYKGNREDAIIHAVGANQAHGLRRTNQDKRRATEMAFKLMTDKKQNWTDLMLADMIGVSSMFIGNYRREYFPETIEKSRVSSSGKVVPGGLKPVKPASFKAEPIDEDDAPDADEADAAQAKATKPKAKPGSPDNKYPLGLALDHLTSATEKAVTGANELMTIFPYHSDLAEALGSKPATAILFAKLRKQLTDVVNQLDKVELPYDVGTD